MTFSTLRVRRLLLRVAAAAAVAAGLASCSGGVDPSPNVSDPTRITILPATAVMYSGLPTTFSITGGTGAYVVTSDNQAVIPSPGSVLRNSVTIVPNNVTAEVSGIVLTVRDTGTNAPVTAVVTVRPGTVNNSLTITPNPLQSASCNPGICSGGDAEVRITISQGGIPLAARGVRFSVVSGDFRFITTPAGTQPEQTALLIDVVTDQSGVARARIRTTALAPNQTALLEVQDLGSGAFQRTSFTIAQFTGSTPAFFTLPASITFTGPFANVCASSASANVTVFGGSPPYAIAGTNLGFSVFPSVVGASGGSFTISLSGTPTCTSNLPVSVTDTTGRTITVSVSNVAGTGNAPAPPISVAPRSLSLACSFGSTAVTSSVVVSGGSTPLAASSDHPRVTATVNQRTVTVQRLGGDGATTYPTTATVTITDGTTSDVATAVVPANCP